VECAHIPWPSNEEFLRGLSRRAAAERVPLAGSLALTHRCNLRCVHCYLSGAPAPRAELTAEQWRHVLDEVTEAGCLSLLITGGEPLLRSDFRVIYRHARSNGLLVTVFSNGTLISDEVIDLFREYPPRAVELSLYGVTAGTYERITGVPGSYGRCRAGIERLLDAGINVRLKTILMTLNAHEFSAIEQLAFDWGVRFRFDAAIFPRLNGDRAPLALRVAPEEAVARELADPSRLLAWRQYYDERADLPVSKWLYNCGAGRTGFHVDPYGYLQPCLMAYGYRYGLLGGSFDAGWRQEMPAVRERRAGEGDACSRCEMRVLCGYCPAFSALDSGAEDIRSDYLCALGHLRYRAVAQELCEAR